MSGVAKWDRKAPAISRAREQAAPLRRRARGVSAAHGRAIVCVTYVRGLCTLDRGVGVQTR